MNLHKLLKDIRQAGAPKKVGEGKVQELEGLSPLGTAERIEELSEIQDQVREWKLHAVLAFKQRMRGK